MELASRNVVKELGRKRTLRLETRSAVSRRVSCDIWSTMLEIFGFVEAAAAAAVESHRRAGDLR